MLLLNLLANDRDTAHRHNELLASIGDEVLILHATPGSRPASPRRSLLTEASATAPVVEMLGMSLKSGPGGRYSPWR